FPEQAGQVCLAARLFLITQYRCDKDGKILSGCARKAQSIFRAFQCIPNNLVGRVRTQVHLASPLLQVLRAGVFLCLGRSSTSKLSTPGSSDRLRPLSHCISSWPASSTAMTVPQEPAGTGLGSSDILRSRMRVPGG